MIFSFTAFAIFFTDDFTAQEKNSDAVKDSGVNKEESGGIIPQAAKDALLYVPQKVLGPVLKAEIDVWQRICDYFNCKEGD